jgi:hypothetical protein
MSIKEKCMLLERAGTIPGRITIMLRNLESSGK